MIASMEDDQQLQDAVSQHYGSDDEEYDQIFMECTAVADTEQQYTNTNFEDADAMDMTDG